MPGNKVRVHISKRLHDKVKRRVQVSEDEFESVDEHVEFVLTEVVKDEHPEQVYTKEEEKEIKRRLKSLGYLQVSPINPIPNGSIVFSIAWFPGLVPFQLTFRFLL